ncbi:MAG: PEP-CTERM sorting domain-containing protein [Tepidisphaeraceae bacterium]
MQVASNPAPLASSPDFQFTPNPSVPAFTNDTGALGNGDGNLPLNQQTAPGLEAITAYPVTAPGADPNSNSVFYDTSLYLSGLAANGSAVQTTLPFGVEDSQSLGSGSFQLWSTSGNSTPATPTLPVTNPNMVLLLSGNISSATIAGLDGGSDGATFSAPGGVTYTGGLLLTALLANGGSATGGDISFSMVNVIPGFGINAGSHQLNPFTSDATGLLDITAVPEPTSLGVLAIGSMFLMRRRASRRTR